MLKIQKNTQNSKSIPQIKISKIFLIILREIQKEKKNLRLILVRKYNELPEICKNTSESGLVQYGLCEDLLDIEHTYLIQRQC